MKKEIPLVQIDQTLPLLGDSTQKIKQATMVKVDTAKAKRRKDGKKHMFNNELIDKAVDAFDFDSLV